MPKPHTYPTLFDDALQINIKKLKELGYFEANTHKTGNLVWTTNNWRGTTERGKISITVNLIAIRPYIELNYILNGEPIKYKVMLETQPSNLGKGLVWYFLCPNTLKRCRKLYCIGGYFYHRDAFKSCMYESQTQTKKWRNMEKVYGCYLDIDDTYHQLYKKHFKKYYKGKPTKRYLKLKNQIEKYEKIPIEDIERLLVFGN
ncbi:hypothetical protein D9V96_008305 [Zobellia laminariae]|uniref:hypothetical protein n=1 Tax=Zobellia laminariae TaxID=248906 RepID=UPI0012D90957|nr:hypothetical protein [Zobellia laminariae]